MTESAEGANRPLIREISKNLSSRDRMAKADLVKRRRATGYRQVEIDRALGLPEGSIQELESYDSDPLISELRHYEAYILFAEEMNRQSRSTYAPFIREEASIYTFEPRVGMKMLRKDTADRLWTISRIFEDGIELEGASGRWSIDDLKLPPVLPKMRVRFLAGGDAVWHVESVIEDWVRIRGWQNSPPFKLDEFWKRFDLLDEYLTDRLVMSQELGGLDSSVPTDEEILEIHSDGNLWAEPDDQRARFLRWLAAHDQKIYADARREIEDELGVERENGEPNGPVLSQDPAAWMALKNDNLVSLIDSRDTHTRRVLEDAGYDLVPLYRKG